MAVKPAPDGFEAEFEAAGARARRVTPEDAEMMKAAVGKWFEVLHSTKGKSNTYGVAKALREKLPVWYGGEWQATTLEKKVYARFMGSAESD